MQSEQSTLDKESLAYNMIQHYKDTDNNTQAISVYK